ncbi:cyclic nucleotide-binding domain-containing protein [Bradyrhizobium sp. CSA112]|nr:cyclic nucleotide-binding domain-containing protein [Bradyrhizobium sp. CSA112]
MGRILVKAKSKPPFNVATFLSSVDGGRTLSTYRKNKRVFLQGDPADSVFYIREGSVKGLRCFRAGEGSGRRAIHAKGDFFGEGCLTGHAPAQHRREPCPQRKTIHYLVLRILACSRAPSAASR